MIARWQQRTDKSLKDWSTKAAGYSVLADLDDTIAEQISIVAAQPKLDLGVLKDLRRRSCQGARPRQSRDRAGIADQIRSGLKHVAPDRLVVAPDCGMKYMPRHIAFGKLKAMCDAAARVRADVS